MPIAISATSIQREWLPRMGLFLVALLLALAASALAAAKPGPIRGAVESCPGSTALSATFTWSNGAWTTADATGINVSGDSSVAYWTSPANISAVVISAGSATVNFVYDPQETAGEIAA